jgi:hypothetical protein
MFRRAGNWDEGLITARISETLNTSPAQYTLKIPQSEDKENLNFKMEPGAKIMSKNLKNVAYLPRYFSSPASK